MKNLLEEAWSHLAAALGQTIESDDQIIIGHIRSAHDILNAVIREVDKYETQLADKEKELSKARDQFSFLTKEQGAFIDKMSNELKLYRANATKITSDLVVKLVAEIIRGKEKDEAMQRMCEIFQESVICKASDCPLYESSNDES